MKKPGDRDSQHEQYHNTISTTVIVSLLIVIFSAMLELTIPVNQSTFRNLLTLTAIGSLFLTLRCCTFRVLLRDTDGTVHYNHRETDEKIFEVLIVYVCFD